MKKTLKKVITFLICSSMLISSAAGVFAAVDAPATYTDVIYENDGSSSAIIGSGCMSWADTGDAHHGKADVVQATDDLTYAAKDVTIDTGRDYVLSFDFKTTANDHPFKFMLRDTNGKDFAHFSVDAYGNAVIANTGWSLWDLNGNYNGQYRVGFPYTANEWHTVDAVFHPNGEDTTIDWYFDGEFKVTADTTGDSNQGLKGESGILKQIYIASTKTGANCGGDLKEGVTWNESKVMYVDNMRISYVDTYEGYYAKAEYASGEAIVTFNETPAGNLTTAVVKDVAGNTVSNGTVTQEGRKLYIPVDATKLKEDRTYYVILPSNVNSVTGKALANNAVSFKAQAVETQGLDATLYTQDFESVTDGSLAPGLGYSDVDTKTYSYVDETHKKAWLLNGDYSGIKYVRCLPVDDTNFGISDEIVVSADFYLNEMKRTADIRVQDQHGNAAFGFCFFDAAGHFVVIKNKNHVWSQNEIVSESNDTYIVANTPISVQKWYTVKMVINTTDRKVTYYLGADGTWETVATVDILQGTQGTNYFDELRLQGWDNNTNSKRPYGNFYIDNIKIGYQNINVTTAKTLATATNNIAYDFSEQADKLDDKYLLDADVTFTEANKPLYFRTNDTKNPPTSGLIFNVDAAGNLSMSKSLLNWKADPYMQSLNTTVELNKPVNIKLLVYKTKFKTVSVFVNDNFVRSLALGWGNEPGSAGYLTDNMGAANFVKGDNNTSPNIVNKVSIGNFTEKLATDIRLTDASDNVYSIYTANIPGNLSSIDVYYSDAVDVTEGKAPTATLKNAEGADVTLGTPTFDADAKKLSYPVSTFLANGTYTLAVTNAKTTSGAAVDNVQVAFDINGDDRVTVEDFKYVTEGDGELLGTPGAGVPLYVNAEVTNYTPVQKNVVVLIAEYSGNRLSDVSYKELPIPSGETLTVNSTTNQVTMNYTEGCTYKAMIWSSFDTGVPYADAIDL